MPSDSLEPSAALAPFAEALVRGQRVLVVADSSSSLAVHLLDRGARLVHVCDWDPARLAEASARNRSRNVSFGPLSDGGLGVRDGTFETALVENLAAVPDAPAVLRWVRRALSQRGTAIVASPNPDVKVRLIPDSGNGPPSSIAMDYYALYDAVASHFESVTMLGQTAFVGYAVAAFAPEGDPEPVVDSGLVPGGAEEPEWFVAVASARAPKVEDFAIVQMPFRNVLGPSQGKKLEDQLRAARAAERSAVQRMAALENELSALREQQRTAPAPPPEADAVELERLRSQLHEREAWILQLESRAAAADARADVAETELGQERARAEAEAARVASLQEASEQAEARAAAAESAEATEADVSRLEAALRERGTEIRRLQADLRETERTGRELVAALEQARAAAGADRSQGSKAEGHVAAAEEAGSLRERLDRLAAVNAEREADLEAARWTVQELEGRLAAGAGEGLERELREARARLQRQSVLLAQLRAAAEGSSGRPERSLTGA